MELWDHQKRCFERAKANQNFALFLEMGTGKTAIAIKLLEHRCAVEHRLLKILIFCPPVVIKNWQAEFHKHSTIPPRSIVPLCGSGVKRQKQFVTGLRQGAFIYITNYESLLMQGLYEAFLQWFPDVLIFDESHKCKDMKAKRTKLAVILSKNVRNVYILSGTPILNSPMDIFSQFLILDGGQTFGENFYTFRPTYFYDKNAAMPRHRYFPNWVIKPGALNEINRKIYNKAFRITKGECLDLPPLVKKSVYVEMNSEQAKLYKEMEKNLITYIDDDACVAKMALTKALRLQQIVSGYAKLASGEERKIKNNPRQQALHDLLEQLTPNHKVIVWSVFKENYAQVRSVCKNLGVGYVECHGEISGKQKFDAVERFAKDDSIRVYSGHPHSGGIGVNLVGDNYGSYAIFYTRNFSLEDDLQAQSRNHRSGAEAHKKITRIDIVTPDTIDQIVLDALSRKEAISEKVLARIKEL